MTDRPSKTAGTGGEKETWSRSEEAWQKVGHIVNNGIISQVEAKQAETREYLETVEERLNEIIRQANADQEEDPIQLSDTAAILPSGSVNQEITRAVGAINLVTDPELKFRLTTFIDDYRRILTQNREPEKAEIVEDLLEYFEKGSLDFVEMEVETKEMIESLALVEQEVEKTQKIKDEVINRVVQYKTEKEIMHPTASQANHRATAAPSNTVHAAVDKKRSPNDLIGEVVEMVNKPHVLQAMGIADHATVIANLEALAAKNKKK